MAAAGAGAGVGARYLHPAWWDEGVLQLRPPKCATAAAAAAAWAPQQHYEWHEDPQLLPFYAVVGMPTPEVLGLISSIVEQTACGEESLGELPGEAVEGLSRTSSVTSVSNACFWYGDDDGRDGDWREEGEGGERGRRRSSGRASMRRSGGSVEFALDQLQSVRVIPPRAAVRLSAALEDAGLLGLGSMEENRRFFEASATRVAQWAAGGRGEEAAAAAPLRASANPWGIGQADGPVYYSEYCAGWRLLRAEYEGDAASLARDLRVAGPAGRAILAGIPAAAGAEGPLFEGALEHLCDEAGLSSAAEAAAAAAAEFRARMGGPAKAVVDDLPDEEDCEGDFDVDDMGCGGDDY